MRSHHAHVDKQTLTKIKNKNMESMQQVSNQAQQLQAGDMDFDITRTFTVLAATLILPVYLALSVVSYSLGVLL
jgi:hypothetical protein